jgi:hypothetical protein
MTRYSPGKYCGDLARGFRCSACEQGVRYPEKTGGLGACRCGNTEEGNFLEIEKHLKLFVDEMRDAVHEASDAELEDLLEVRSPPLIDEVLARDHYLRQRMHVIRAKLLLRVGKVCEAEKEWRKLIANSIDCV